MSWGKITRDAADDAFSKWIRIRDRACRRCGSPVAFNSKGMPISHQASHFQGRRKENTRFDPQNVDCLCSGCHSYFTANPGEHYEWQVLKKGKKLVDEVILRSNMYLKKDRKLQAIYWKQKLKELSQ